MADRPETADSQPHSVESAWDRLTEQQRIALRYLAREGEGHDYFLWDEGVRPWPTMDNLVDMGLVEIIRWEEMSAEERGYVRRLTDAGRAITAASDRER